MTRKKCCMYILLGVASLSFVGCGLTHSQGKKNNLKIETSEDNPDGSSEAGADSEDEKTGNVLDDPDVEKKISEIEKYINNYFYFDTDYDTQEEALYDGIMGGLDDPYSVYYTKEEFEDLMEEDSGEYFGVGAVVTQGAD